MQAKPKPRAGLFTVARRLILALALLPPWASEAVVLEPLSVDSLATQADLVLHGVVLSKTCQRDPTGRIYTKVELRVTDIWKGAIAGSPFLIVHGGGILGDKEAAVPAQVQYEIGEEVVAFLVRNQRGEGVTIGLMQGKFRVWRDAVRGTAYVVSPFHGATEEQVHAVALQAAPPASGIGAPIRLTNLKRKVQEAGR